MKLYFTKLATGIIIKSGGKQFISRNFDTAFSLNYISHFNKVDLITSEDATNFELIKKILISGKYEVFLKDNYVDVLNNLKTLKSSISHKKENMIDRELLLRINEALEYVSFHNRTKEDHFNLSGIINEQSTFKVYNSVKKLFNLNNKDIINNHSAKNNRLIYFYTSIVSH